MMAGDSDKGSRAVIACAPGKPDRGGPRIAAARASTRDRCEQEATLVGIGSYVDLLTCMQMADPARFSPTPSLRGASKDRNKS